MTRTGFGLLVLNGLPALIALKTMGWGRVQFVARPIRATVIERRRRRGRGGEREMASVVKSAFKAIRERGVGTFLRELKEEGYVYALSLIIWNYVCLFVCNALFFVCEWSHFYRWYLCLDVEKTLRNLELVSVFSSHVINL